MLCCGHVHGAEQQRPPQIAVLHSSGPAHTAPGAFLATHFDAEQKLVLVQSAEVAQLILHAVAPQM